MGEQAKTVVLIDGFDDGHHLTHLRNYAKTLLDMGHHVLELLPEPDAVDGWMKQQCAEQSSRIRFFRYRHPVVTSPSWRLRNTYEPLMTWRRAGQAVRRAARDAGREPDLVFFCWLDDYIVGCSPLVRRLLPLVFPYRWSGVFFHPWHLRIDGGETRHESVATEAMLGCRGCSAVAVLDQGITGKLSAGTGKAVVDFPDETEEARPDDVPEVVREIRHRAAGRRIIGLLGNLSRRKGVVSLLEAAATSGDRDWFFVFAGLMGEEQLQTFDAADRQRVCEAAQSPDSNVFFHTTRIENERDFNGVVSACDLLYAAYEMFAHSSGIVTKAGFFEKPIIVSRGYYMEEVVREFRLGLAVDPHEPGQVEQAIEALLDPTAFQQQVGQPDYARFQQAHSVKALKPAFARILEKI